jgi:hypothetical protein
MVELPEVIKRDATAVGSHATKLADTHTELVIMLFYRYKCVFQSQLACTGKIFAGPSFFFSFATRGRQWRGGFPGTVILEFCPQASHHVRSHQREQSKWEEMSIQCDIAGVGQVLEHLLNPDNTIRKQAEAIINQFLKKEYRAALWPVLLQLLRTSENPQARRHRTVYPNAPSLQRCAYVNHV